MSTLSLYEIGAEFARLEAALLASEGEMSDEVAAAFDALGQLEAAKIDGYRAVVLRFERHAAACEDEANLLDQKALHAKQAAKRLKERLHAYMVAKGVTELQGEIFKAAIQKNGGALPVTVLVPLEQLDARFTKVKLEADTEKLRQAATDGLVTDAAGTPVARVEERGSHVRFR